MLVTARPLYLPSSVLPLGKFQLLAPSQLCLVSEVLHPPSDVPLDVPCLPSPWVFAELLALDILLFTTDVSLISVSSAGLRTCTPDAC